MRIAMLTTNMARGGAETLVAQLAMELRRRGRDVHVVSLLPPSAFREELAEAGVPLHAPGLLRLPFLLRRLRPQVLHCHMFHANIAGRLLRTVLPFPAVISTIHSMAEMKRGSRGIFWRDQAYRWTESLAVATVAVSQAAADQHIERGAVRSAVVIPNGIDTSVFRRDESLRARMRTELNVGNAFVWIAVGRLMWKKNFAALLRAFPRDPDQVLLLAGAGPEEAELRAMAGPNVRFLGERTDIPALLSAADAFVLSSVVEGLPLALLEAAACELPCLAADVGGVKETGIGLVVQHEELAGGLRSLRGMNEDERRALGAGARRRVLERYSLQAAADAWEALYSQLTRST